MTQVHACFNVFNEKANLQRSLESVSPFVDHILIVDGAYKDFPYNGNNGASDDGTLDLIHKLQREWQRPKITLIESPAGGWENEMQKRTAYCDAIPEGEWIYIQDGDEVLKYGGEQLQQLNSINEVRNFDLGCVILSQHNTGVHNFGTMGRIYRKKKGMKYGNGHAHVIYEGGYRWRDLFIPLVIEEDHDVRPEQRNKMRLDFYKSGKCK